MHSVFSNFSNIAGIASIVGLMVGLAFGAYQYFQARKARMAAEAERKRAVQLEDFLASQRWQQLLSISEQIDSLERTGKQELHAEEAASHARLKGQYSSLITILATFSGDFSAKILRHWIEVGRLIRPWQIAEALVHLKTPTLDDADDHKWVLDTARAQGATSDPVEVDQPSEPDDWAMAYVTLAYLHKDDIATIAPSGGYTRFAIVVLLGYLASDCLNSIAFDDKFTDGAISTWGHGQFFVKRAAYYAEQDVSLLVNKQHETQRRLGNVPWLFTNFEMLIPTAEALEYVTAKRPDLAAAATKLCHVTTS